MALASATGCGDETPARPATLERLADAIIVPHYAELSRAAQALESATETLCATPGAASLTAARSALASTRRAWKTVEVMAVGPAMVRRSRAAIDWPIDEDGIEALVAAGAPPTIDANYIGTSVGSDERGLRAVEYVLGAGGDAIGALEDPRRCDYLVAVAEVIRAESGELLRSWSESFDGGPPYRVRLADPGNPSDLGTLVNDAFFLLQEITTRELGQALGLLGGADLEAIAEGPAGLGLADMRARVEGVRLVLVGDGEEVGLAPLLSPDLADRLRRGFDAAEAAMAEIEGPLRTAVAVRRDDVIRVREALRPVEVALATEVMSTLGVTMGFGYVDGDGGA